MATKNCFIIFFLQKYRFFYHFRMVVSDDFKIILEKKGKIIFYLIKKDQLISVYI